MLDRVAATRHIGASRSVADALVLGGALLLLVISDWLLGAFLGGGELPVTSEIAAAEIILFGVARRRWPTTAWTVPYHVILAVLVAAIVAPAVPAALFLLRDVRALVASSPADLLMTLTAWVATVLLALGTWLTWRDRAA